MKHFYIILLATFLFALQSKAQETEKIATKDTLKLIDYIKQSKWELYHRTAFVATVNEGDLKDDAALGTGIGVGLLTKSFHGFQLGVGAFYTFGVVSTNLSELDAKTQTPNRYEIGLFDVENSKNQTDLGKLEKLYLRYNLGKSFVEFGRIAMNTPFINPQDGRMRPTAQQGIWLSINEIKKLQISGGFISHISPRSTVRWATIGETMGMYPQGVSTNGTKSNYLNNIQTQGLAIINLQYQASKQLKFNVWNGFLENVMNIAILELNHEKTLANGQSFYQNLMYIHQNSVNYGGNADQSKTYIDKNATANLLSMQVGFRTKKWNTNVSYTRITKDGRYLMPREWGRDWFYTFMPRERNEGFGDVHAIVLRTMYAYNGFKSGLVYGYFQLPDVKNYSLNKYGIPSYHQINYDLGYSFKNFLKGFELRGLIVYKINAGETYDNPRFVYNKVDMINFNVVLDFKL